MDIKSNITKFVNLASDDSLSAFMGHTAQQFHGAYEIFYNFLKEISPKRILEIGTGLGGFTTFLQISCDDLKLDTVIRSYDITQYPWYKSIALRGVDIRTEDIFLDDFMSLKEEVINFTQSDGVTIVLCDGGNKIAEFNLISKYIKNGDYILAHDYAENAEVFENKIKNKIWDWIEITNDHINQATIENHLLVYQKETFENVAWTCRKKQLPSTPTS